ncbi:hypothetical protein GW17_00022306, partial [Ensete ventricosum]
GDEKPIDVDGFPDLGQRPRLPRGLPAPPPAPLPGFPSPPPPRKMVRPRSVRIGPIHDPPRLLRCPDHCHLGDLRHLALRRWCPDLRDGGPEVQDFSIRCQKSKYVELKKIYYTYLSELWANIVESLLEESMETLNSKELHLEEKYKLIGEMEEKIQFLQNALHEIKVCI